MLLFINLNGDGDEIDSGKIPAEFLTLPGNIKTGAEFLGRKVDSKMHGRPTIGEQNLIDKKDGQPHGQEYARYPYFSAYFHLRPSNTRETNVSREKESSLVSPNRTMTTLREGITTKY